MADPELNSTLTHNTIISPGLAIMQISPNGWAIPDFKPGQYCAIGLPGSASRCPESEAEPEDKKPDPAKFIRRAYSLASSPLNKEFVELYVILVPEGGLTPRLMHLNIGDKLFVSPKVVGIFTMDDVPEDANLVFMGTGTGLAPYMSMLRTNILDGGKRKVAVLHGVRHSWELGYRSELELLEEKDPNLTYIPTVSRPHKETVPWKGRTGYVQEIWKESLLDKKWGCELTPKNTHIFLCGNPGMIRDMEELAQQAEFQEHTRRTPGQMHVEKYW